MAERGWYADPGGSPGMYRYWDGAAWSEALSPTPMAPPPTYAYAGIAPGPIQLGNPAQPQAYQPDPNAYATYQGMAQKPKRSPGPWIILGIGVLVVAVLVYLAITRVINPVGPGATTNGGGDSTSQVCPQEATDNQRADHPDDNRVYGGKLSYPMLTDPWSAVQTDDTRIPFGRDVAEQMVVIHPYYDGSSSWVASVMVGELYAGDGFYSPQQGSEIVNRCIFGTFYGGARVVATTISSGAYSLDGYDGWKTVTNLTFSIPNLPTTNELATVIIVATSAMSSSIFYSSIPGDASQYNADVDQAIAGLRVET